MPKHPIHVAKPYSIDRVNIKKDPLEPSHMLGYRKQLTFLFPPQINLRMRPATLSQQRNAGSVFNRC
jgi:hypothetical protein